MTDAAPPPRPISIAGPPSWMNSAPAAKAGFVRVRCRDIADAAGDHDRLVIAAHLARDRLLERAEIAAQIGTAEFVVECGAADRTIDHDLQCATRCARGRRSCRVPTAARRPGCADCETRETGQSRLRLRAASGRTFVADLAARARRRARIWRDRGRVVVRLDLHQDMRAARRV